MGLSSFTTTICAASPTVSLFPQLRLPSRSDKQKPNSLSCLSSFPTLNIRISTSNPSNPNPNPSLSNGSFIRAAWTRRSRGEAAKKPNRKSWRQRTDMYMRPFLLNVFFSKRFIHAKVMHRGTSKVISVATTNSKDLRNSLPSLTDHNACRVIGRLIADRSKEADVYAMAYEPRKDERIEAHWKIAISDSERFKRQSEALHALETVGRTTTMRDLKVPYHLSLEYAEQRKLDATLYSANCFLKLEGNHLNDLSIIKGY